MAGWTEQKSRELHVCLDAVPESVPEARLRVRSWCEDAHVDGEMRSDLLLAVSEAAANVVLHAYPDGGAGTFSLDVRMDADILVLSVCDEGVGTAGSMPSDGCGLGLEIIARMFPEFTLAEAEPGTRVTIRASAA
jgi:anti-sigma regulatory factor (Ser/Thr protein kinase)